MWKHLTMQTPVMSSQVSEWPLQLHGRQLFKSLRKYPFAHTYDRKHGTELLNKLDLNSLKGTV